MVGIIDSHCHLNYPDFEDDLEEVIQRAQSEGVQRLITISTKIEQTHEIKSIADAYDCVYGTIGVHPLEAKTYNNLYEDIIAAAQHSKIVGIGETGLDYFYKTVSPDIQKESFYTHIQAANTLDLPLIVHTREAEADTLGFIKEARCPGVLHCFTSSYKMAAQAIDMGFYISFSGILTYSSAQDLREVAKKLPKNRVLIETDAPYLTPKSRRKDNKRNEPLFVKDVCLELAKIWCMDYNDVAKITTENCLRLFKGVKV